MGLYDSFYAEYVCPYCKQKSLIEAQTKRYECVLAKWMLGDEVEDTNKGDEILRLNGFCQSHKCMSRVENNGFGMVFLVRIHVENGIFTKAECVRVVNRNKSNNYWLEEKSESERELAHPDDDWSEEEC